MPRTCAREGCGKRVVDGQGKPLYKKFFCDDACSMADRAEKLRSKRQKKVKKYQWIRVNGKKKIGVRTLQAAIRIAEGFAAQAAKGHPVAEAKEKSQWKKNSKDSTARSAADECPPPKANPTSLVRAASATRSAAKLQNGASKRI